jgi:hypothetical protein|tara:strand:- start:533 stop:718 length:186 start_codon:yes stop_codon:yes gene_type:complete
MKFRTKELAFTHIENKGFKYNKSMSIKEDKWFMFKKGKSYVIITPKYDNILGTNWIVRAWS